MENHLTGVIKTKRDLNIKEEIKYLSVVPTKMRRIEKVNETQEKVRGMANMVHFP